MGKDIHLRREITAYTPDYLKGVRTRVANSGGTLYDVHGNPVPKLVELPEQTANNYDGRYWDGNRMTRAVNLMGLARLAPSLERGSIGGNSGFFGMQKPYITIINKPPIGTEDLNKYIGLPLESKVKLSTLSGYTEVSQLLIPLSYQDKTFLREEEAEIRELLSGGVIL